MDARVFTALGDPIRLQMVQRLSFGASCTMGELTEKLHISRQGARKHLQVLVGARLVHLKPKGRVVRVSLNMDAIKKSKEFISRLELQWDKRLSKLKDILENE